MKRPVALILLALALAGALWLRDQNRVATFDWDWRGAPLVPGSEVRGLGGAVAVLEAPGAVWAADLLITTGVLGVGIGLGDAPVRLVLGGPGCEAAGEAVIGPGCSTAFPALGLGAPEELESVQEAIGVGDLEALGPLPVPVGAAVWPEVPAGWSPLVLLNGRPAALAREGLVVFAVDPAAQAKALRQGDPTLADLDTDGMHGPKPNDLRPFPWSDDAWVRPTAASWTEVLIAALEHAGDVELPRLWPLPTREPSALIMTSDQDFVASSWVDPLLARAEAVGGEVTVLTTAGTRQTNDAAADGGGGERPAVSGGHGLGLHPNLVELSGDARIAALRTQAERHGPAATARMHYLSWWGHAGPLPTLVELGVAMDLSFVGIEPRLKRPGFGFGDGRPMRWHTDDGVLPIWVQPTHIEDDVLIGSLAYAAGLTPSDAAARSEALLDRAIVHRVPLVANLHPMLVAKHEGVLFDGLLAAANRRAIPIMSAERLAASATARLHFAQQATVSLASGAWTVTGPDVGAPVWRWTRGGACKDAHSIRPGGPAGCLEQP